MASESELRSALTAIALCLGPSPDCELNGCEGCLAEMGEAFQIAMTALGLGVDEYELLLEKGAHGPA